MHLFRILDANPMWQRERLTGQILIQGGCRGTDSDQTSKRDNYDTTTKLDYFGASFKDCEPVSTSKDSHYQDFTRLCHLQAP